MARGNDGRIWVCLTDIAKASGKLFGHWNSLKSTTEFLTEFENVIGKPIMKVIQGGDPSKQGTWAVKEVADEFMKWCNKPKKSPTRKGVIYVFKDNGNNAFKIGFTVDLQKRQKQHLTSNPFLELVAVYENCDLDLEGKIHNALDKYRIKGTTEWYKANKNITLILSEFFCKQDKKQEQLAHSEAEMQLDELLEDVLF